MLDARLGCSSCEDAARRIAANTVRFAKRQMTFFRAFAGVRWVEAGAGDEVRAELRAASPDACAGMSGSLDELGAS
jgi:tRNA A37 N6-isopentenylltransferase MiaA